MTTPRCNEQVGPDGCIAAHGSRFVGAHREQSGTWYLTFAIRCMVELPDGRKVELPEREVTVRAYRQIGRKPVDGKVRKRRLSRALI